RRSAAIRTASCRSPLPPPASETPTVSMCHARGFCDASPESHQKVMSNYADLLGNVCRIKLDTVCEESVDPRSMSQLATARRGPVTQATVPRRMQAALVLANSQHLI